jgi:hypothetical protein
MMMSEIEIALVLKIASRCCNDVFHDGVNIGTRTETGETDLLAEH